MTGLFFDGSLCEWVLIGLGPFVLGCYVMGPLVMGPYVGAPVTQLLPL